MEWFQLSTQYITRINKANQAVLEVVSESSIATASETLSQLWLLVILISAFITAIVVLTFFILKGIYSRKRAPRRHRLCNEKQRFTPESFK